MLVGLRCKKVHVKEPEWAVRRGGYTFSNPRMGDELVEAVVRSPN